MTQTGIKNSNYKHGHNSKCYQSPTYISWASMKHRCKSKHKSYYNYKGISVCDRWNSFENFLLDMGERPKGKTIDRIDNNKGYSEENCRWANRAEQQRNTKRATLMTYNGCTKHIIDWAEELEISVLVIMTRIRRGWSIERIMKTKVRKYGI